MKPRYIIGAVLAVGCIATSIWLLSATGVQYASIATAVELKKRVSIKGHWEKEKESSYDSEKNLFTFSMRDDSSNSVRVEYSGSKPNNFELAESVVVKGSMDNGVFKATDILTKCPSKYEGSNQLKDTPTTSH